MSLRHHLRIVIDYLEAPRTDSGDPSAPSRRNGATIRKPNPASLWDLDRTHLARRCGDRVLPAALALRGASKKGRPNGGANFRRRGHGSEEGRALLPDRPGFRDGFQHGDRAHPRRRPDHEGVFQGGAVRPRGRCPDEIDPRPFQVALEQAEGQLAKDVASQNDAKVDLDRYHTLWQEGVIPRQQLDSQQATVGQFDGSIKSDQAQIDNQKLQLIYCRITSPIGGRVGLRLVDPGNIVHAADANGMLVITQVQPIAVIFTLPEDNLPQVVAEMRNRQLAVEAYSRDNNDEARRRQAADHRQSDRPDHRDDQVEIAVRQSRSVALAEPVREHRACF